MTCLFSKHPNYIKLEEMATSLRELNDAWEYLHNYTMDM